MVWVAHVLAMESLVWAGVLDLFPRFPRVVLFRVVLPFDKVIVTVVFRIYLRVQDALHNVFLLSFNFYCGRRVLRLTGMTRAYWFKEVDMEDWVHL